MTCQHGDKGFCWDDASAEERETFDHLHRHAHAWALPSYGGDVAEEYAAAYAQEHWRHGLEDAPAHSWERAATLLGTIEELYRAEAHPS